MIPTDWILALIGGALIGSASFALLFFNGRIAGISGIMGGLLRPQPTREVTWRAAFLVGMVGAGAIMTFAMPSAFPETLPRSLPVVAVAGLLVGVGTRMGSGCTSGHGVCGLSRRSARSLVATLTFMGAGVLTVALTRLIAGGAS